MRDRDAQDLIRMIEGNWHMDLGPARGLWRTELMMWDAELATKAVTHLARRQQYKIVLADLVSTLEMLNRNLKDEARRARDAKAIEEGRRGYAPPIWVLVWKWLRNCRPRDTRSFPQQDYWGDPQNMMSREEYDALQEEWEAAGSPKEAVQLLKSL